MNVAVTHDLPSGGALRVLAEWCARTRAQSLTVYCRDASVHAFAPLGPRARVIVRPLRGGASIAGQLARLWSSPRDGHALAQQVDRGGHDVVFCFASALTQSPDVLPYLRTPSLYYAPEPLRAAYEPRELVAVPDDWRGVITRRGLNPIERRRARLDRRYMAAAAHVVTHSHFTQRTLREIYDVRAEVVPLGVDARAFTPGAGPRGGFVLAVGAVAPLKGHELVVDAVARMTPPRPPLVVVGDRGFSGEALRDRARRAGVELELRHQLPFAELVGLYQTAGVIACGQIREPFGLTPLEAMACATPVVAVADGGFRETIHDGVDGLLVPRDPAAMAAALERVLTDPELARRLGRNGRAVVEAEWTWERTAAGFDALLEGIAAGSGVAAADAVSAG